VRSVDAESLKLGDVVIYKSGEKMVTHRIVSPETTTSGQVFVMRGDDEASQRDFQQAVELGFNAGALAAKIEGV
jgi:hypothetical protein